MSDSATIVQKLWNYCNVLRDDGLSYQEYLEQLTFLLFLKMADERATLTGEPQPRLTAAEAKAFDVRDGNRTRIADVQEGQ